MAKATQYLSGRSGSSQVCLALNPVLFPQITIIAELSGVFTPSPADRAVLPCALLSSLVPLGLGLHHGTAGGNRKHCR